MFGYYLHLAVRSFRRNKTLTALMVIAIALGIGASMTTLTVFHVLSGDPIPSKSDRLFYVQMDPGVMRGYTPGEDPETQLTRFDAEALLRDKRADRQVMMSGGGLAVEPDGAGLTPFTVESRYASADFFPMFDAPFAYGRPWTASEDASRARVVVLAKELNDRLYGGADSVGRTIRLNQTEYRIVGVLDRWRMAPRFYDLTQRSYGTEEQVLLPFSTSREFDYGSSGSMNCWGDLGDDPEAAQGLNAPCSWIQYWIELDDPTKADDYRAYLANYSDQQRASGRFERPTNVRLSDVMTWLDVNKVVPGDVRLQLWLAFGFLLVCLVNTVGLLLAKFLRRGSEIGVRRALGASRGSIFLQCLVEALVVGIAGGILGLGLALLGLWAVRQQPTNYAQFVQLDPTMLVTTIALATVASLLAGLLPAWRAMQVAPAIQLKSQ